MSKLKDRVFSKYTTERIINFFSPGALVSYNPSQKNLYKFVFFVLNSQNGKEKWVNCNKNSNDNLIFMVVSIKKLGTEAERFVTTFLHEGRLLVCYIYEKPFRAFKRLS